MINKKLVVIPCHAIYLGQSADEIENPTSWIGKYTNKENINEIDLYIEHIRKGVELVTNQNSILVFSGGQTKKTTKLSEAQSYLALSKQLGLTNHIECSLEPYARDSFENLLFSIYRYQELLGKLPQDINVVGFSFKKERFLFHYKTIKNNNNALKLPIFSCNFNYTAVNNPPQKILTKSIANEEMTLKAFLETPLGDSGFLLKKRISRDPWKMKIPYLLYK